MLTRALPELSYLCTVITTVMIPPPPRIDTHAHVHMYTPATHACSVNTDMWYTMLNQTLWLIGCIPPLRFKVMLNPRSLLRLKLPWYPPCASPTPSSHPSTHTPPHHPHVGICHVVTVMNDVTWWGNKFCTLWVTRESKILSFVLVIVEVYYTEDSGCSLRFRFRYKVSTSKARYWESQSQRMNPAAILFRTLNRNKDAPRMFSVKGPLIRLISLSIKARQLNVYHGSDSKWSVSRINEIHRVVLHWASAMSAATFFNCIIYREID